MVRRFQTNKTNSSHKPTFFLGIAILFLVSLPLCGSRFLKKSINISTEILMLFSELLIHTTVGLLEKGLLFPGKKLVCGWNLPYLKVNGICK